MKLVGCPSSSVCIGVCIGLASSARDAVRNRAGAVAGKRPMRAAWSPRLTIGIDDAARRNCRRAILLVSLDGNVKMAHSRIAAGYSNYTGTGNTLDSANRYVRRMILDSMRYWGNEMHVDGFRFDLASAFARNSDGSICRSDPPIFGEIRADPSLGNVRLIAEPWDAAGAYQLGESFPGSRWLQWNGRFRDDVRRFVRGDRGLVPSLTY